MNTIVKYFFVLLLLCTAQYSVVGQSNGQSKNGQGNANGHDKSKGKGPSGENDVIMIHGRNGEEDSDKINYKTFWRRYDESVTKLTNVSGKAKKVRIPIYETSNGMVKGYEDLTNKDETDAVNADVVIPNRNAYWSAAHPTKKARPIGIAHSQGGLVMREWQDREDYFKVMMTVGSPLDGTYSADNLRNGNLAGIISSTSGLLAAGPLASAAASTIDPSVPILISLAALGVSQGDASVVGVLIGVTGVSILVTGTSLLPFVGNDITHWVVNKMEGDDLTTDEFVTNSSYIKDWKNGTRSLAKNTSPRIVVYGQEDDPAHYRVIASFMAGASGNDSDECYYIFSSVIPNFYTAVAAIHAIFGVVHTAYLNIPSAAVHYLAAGAWMLGENVWAHQFGAGWRYFSNNNEDDYNYDGFIHQSSQKGELTNFPTINPNNGIPYIYEAKGVNHAEMGNTDNDVRLHIEALMKGGIVGDIDTRQ